MTFKNNLSIKKLIILNQLAFLFIFSIITFFIAIKDAKLILTKNRIEYLHNLKLLTQETNLKTLEGILNTLSLLPSLHKFDKKLVEKQFIGIMEKTNLFHNILLFDNKGNLIISAKPVAGGLKPPTDRLYFKRVLEQKTLSWGEFAISRSTGKPVIHFAAPVLNKKNEVTFVIVATPVMENIIAKISTTPYKSIILDERGVIVQSKEDKEIGSVYGHYKKIKEMNTNEGIIKMESHHVVFSNIYINGKIFSTLVAEFPYSILSILYEEGFFTKFLFYLTLILIFSYHTYFIYKKLILKPLNHIESHFISFLDREILEPIDRMFFGELDIFKRTYNKFIDFINRKNKEIGEEKNFWHTLFNEIPQPILLVNRDYEVTFANYAFLHTFQIKEEDLKRTHCYEITHKTKNPIDFCPHREILEKNASFTHELYFPDKDKWYYITYSYFTYPNKFEGTLHIFKDITDLKKAEEKRLAIEKQLLHTQKLESLGILAGGIAHDFNNLLMGILGNAELALMMQNKLPPSVIQNIETIKKISEKAAHLTRQMLAYSGKGKFIIKEIEINSFIREIFDLIKVSISKKASFILNLYEKEPLVIIGDPGQIEQVILNLVINASEALEEKEGLITITTGKQYCDSKYLENTVDGYTRNLREGYYVYFEVTDNGCGMDKETMQRIFEPFFTTKFTGRGLGLSAILGIVRGHNGVIKVYSEKGKGTSFKILLPSAKPSLDNINFRNIKGDFKGKTFLVIDDEEVVRIVTKNMIEFLGGKVFEASNGIEGIEILKNNPYKIDIVILDLTMPKLSGEEVFREIKKIKNDVFVILMSGYNEQDISQRLVGKGFAGFIQKPFTMEKLIEVINSKINP